MSDRPLTSAASRNRNLAIACCVCVATMVGAAYAAVPLYDLFCKVTGFGGTTQRVDSGGDYVLDQTMVVRFDANIAASLPWEFRPMERSSEVRIGEIETIYYEVTNLSDETTAGIAGFNVTPLNTGAYFSKINCFCFDEQLMAPGETREMAVTFFIDPAIVDNPETAGISTITLSYTFYAAAVPQGALAATSTDDVARPNM